MPNRTCLECMINPVKEVGEACSYECYDLWIAWHLDRDGEMILLDEDQVLMLPLELQGFHKHTWRNRDRNDRLLDEIREQDRDLLDKLAET